MSKYEWERGSIVIPSKEWSSFRKGLLTQWNEKQEKLLAAAQAAHKTAKEAAKGKRGANRQKAILEAVARSCGGHLTEWGDFEATRRSTRLFGGYDDHQDDVAHERHEAVCRLILTTEGYGRDRRVTLRAPRRKDLDIKPVSKDASISIPYAFIGFCNKTRTVTWDVSENNHACESAHEHWFAEALFAALGKITWTRGSGGEIYGNDEYNRDADYAGGGGNYTVYTFSQAEQRRQRAARRSSYRSTYPRTYRSYAW